MDDGVIDAVIRASSRNEVISEVLRAAGVTKISSHADFCLDFSKRVAKRYVFGDLDFESADRAMNWLFGYSYALGESPGEMPDLARDIYEAFDEGEYLHEGDSYGDDPEAKYTLPKLREIVSKLPSSLS